MLPFY